jgi:hypothetical protein
MTMSDARTNPESIESEIGHGAYGPELLDEPSRPRVDRGDEDSDDLSSTLDADTDVEALRNGGPTRTPGVMTTTGGTAGPNSFKPRPYRPEGVKIAPTTTGDATTGGMETPDRSSTSDASSNAI